LANVLSVLEKAMDDDIRSQVAIFEVVTVKNIMGTEGLKVAEKAVSVTQIGSSSEPIFFGKESLNLKLDDVRLSTSAIGESDVLYRYYLKGGAI
jgi:hypothetical protein